jgi:hypothetical protein
MKVLYEIIYFNIGNGSIDVCINIGGIDIDIASIDIDIGGFLPRTIILTWETTPKAFIKRHFTTLNFTIFHPNPSFRFTSCFFR